jgi:ATPase subunit of ABC transporter with duplicated ATPase domains
MTELAIRTPNGDIHVVVSVHKPLFVLGRNGSGKSGLLQKLNRDNAGRTIYLPGSRTAIFDGEGLNLTPSARKQLTSNLQNWDNTPDARWRNMSGNARNEKAIHDLTAVETQYISEIAGAISNKKDVQGNVDKLQAKNSPLDKVNAILEQANIEVRVEIAGGELKAKTGATIYSFARMSDGERTSLILISEIVSAPANSLFVIDEPELHLHPSIVVPLIAALIRARPDCEFIIGTHQLELPSAVPGSQACIVRSPRWDARGHPTSWDVDIVANALELPEDLRTDILGSRRRVLFTEGTDASR